MYRHGIQEVKPTSEETARIFMLYAGQNFQMQKTGTRYKICCVDIVVYSVFEPSGNGFDVNTASIEVKPVENISECDKEDLLKLIGAVHWINQKSLFSSLSGQKSVFGEYYGSVENIQQVTDFLRTRGYALPYLQWSVDDLVKFNIFKIIK